MDKEIIEIPEKKIKNNKVKATKIKVAAYARVSSETDKQLHSLKAQKEYYEEYCKNHKDWIFIGIYFDEGISGLSRAKRDGFNRMIDAALNGKIDLIVTKSISRFARNTIDTLSITRELRSKRVGVLFEQENINTMDSTSDLVLTILASFAEEESKSISSNIRWGMQQKFREGKFWTTSNIYGYKNGKQKYELVIDESQAPIVRMIFQLILEGYSTLMITRILNFNNIPSPMDKLWNIGVIRKIATNEKHMGDALLQKTFTVDIYSRKHKKNEGEYKQYYIKNSHEPIIPRAVFYETQSVLTRYNHSNIAVNIYSGRIRCDCCGFYYRTQYYYTKYYDEPMQRWICRNKHNKKIRCKNIILYNDELDYACLYIYKELIKRYPDVIENLTNIIDKKIKTFVNLSNMELSLPQNDHIRRTVFRTICEEIIVHDNLSLTFVLIDKSKIDYALPKWSVQNKRPLRSGDKDCIHRK